MRNYILFVVLSLILNLAFSQKLIFSDPIRLQDSINTKYDETLPIVSQDGTELYFSRSSHPLNVGEEKGHLDIWHSEFNVSDSTWSDPHNNLGLLNNIQTNALVGIAADGNKVYLFNSYFYENLNFASLGYSIKEDDTTFSAPEKVDIGKVKTGKNNYGLYMDINEDILLVSMQGKNSLGKEDIYVVLKDEKGKWGKPINLGSTVNTDNFDYAPYLGQDQKTLYFSSYGHEGFGKADIFVTRRLDDTWTNWTEPVNLGSTVNSDSTDEYFTINEVDQAFFASNRAGDNFDIYYSSIRFYDEVEFEKLLVGNVKKPDNWNETYSLLAYANDKNDTPAANIKFTIVNKDGEIVDKAMTDNQGVVLFSGLKGKSEELTLLYDEENKNLKTRFYAVPEFKEGDTVAKDYGKFLASTAKIDSIKKFQQFELIARLTFSSDGSPAASVPVLLTDEDGNIIKRVFTDENGRVSFDKLDPNKVFRIISEDPDANLNVNLNIDGSGLAEKNEEPEVKAESKSKFQQLIGTLFDEKNEPVEDVPVVALDEEGKVVQRLKSDKDGKVVFVFGADNNHTFRLQVADEGKSEGVTLKSALEETYEQLNQFMIMQAEPGLDTILIFFETGKYDLNQYSTAKIAAIAERLKKEDNLAITIFGHTDDVGDEELNDVLSKNRNKAVKSFLLANGVLSSKIKAASYGEANPLHANDSELGRKINRRVEVVFIKSSDL